MNKFYTLLHYKFLGNIYDRNSLFYDQFYDQFLGSALEMKIRHRCHIRTILTQFFYTSLAKVLSSNNRYISIFQYFLLF